MPVSRSRKRKHHGPTTSRRTWWYTEKGRWLQAQMELDEEHAFSAFAQAVCGGPGQDEIERLREHVVEPTVVVDDSGGIVETLTIRYRRGRS
jgi:hypothetical protein